MTDQMRPFYDVARALYPLLPQWYEYTTEDANNPEFRGLNAGGLPIFNVPPGYTLMPDEGAHEAGHAYFALLDAAQDHLTMYWKTRGFPGTWQDALIESKATTGTAAWQLDPRESWAEAFARSVYPTHNEKTMTYGKDMSPLLLRAFFQSLDGTKAAIVPPVKVSATAQNFTMFDSTKASDIPAGAEVVMGYVDGSSAWSAADWKLFPGSRLVRICIFNDRMDADVLDIEPGNNDAKGAVPWVKAKWARSETPTVYCFSDGGPVGFRMSDVRRECDAAGVRRPLFLIAEWDNNPATFDPSGDPEIIGKQYANPTFTGKHYDLSVVAGRWLGEGEDMDRNTFNAWFLEEYGKVGAGAKFDALAEQIGENTNRLDSKADRTHPHTATTTVK
jgi:hypothetical protein